MGGGLKKKKKGKRVEKSQQQGEGNQARNTTKDVEAWPAQPAKIPVLIEN